MLQQTQVATVIPYFHRFLDAFPTIAALAAADEQQVLRLWQGLGYYSRARNLLKAARAVVADHAGQVPTTVDALLTLPGVGRYTAGAIASIAHGTQAPIVDGNVARVVCRIDAIRDDPRERTVLAQLWTRAEQLVPVDRPGNFNSAMMELGATVCIPRNPQCLICPVSDCCEAREQNLQNTIPPAKKTRETPMETRTVFCLSRTIRGETQYAFEQRPTTGRWAGMWQFLTRDPSAPDAAALARSAGDAIPIGTVTHALTHRRYTFHVVLASLAFPLPIEPRWSTLEASDELPLPKPHVTIRGMLRGRDTASRRQDG